MTPSAADNSWFLAQLKPNAARIAQKNLARQGFVTFLPMEERTRPRNGKFVTGLQPLFPGYLFVGFDAARGCWRAVNSTCGVTRLVRFGSQPAPVPAEVVSQLMRRCDADGRMLPPGQPIPGDSVEITTGPLARFVAQVERISPDRRIWVLMEIMGGQTRVALRADQLQTLRDPPRRIGGTP